MTSDISIRKSIVLALWGRLWISCFSLALTKVTCTMLSFGMFWPMPDFLYQYCLTCSFLSSSCSYSLLDLVLACLDLWLYESSLIKYLFIGWLENLKSITLLCSLLQTFTLSLILSWSSMILPHSKQPLPCLKGFRGISLVLSTAKLLFIVLKTHTVSNPGTKI